MEPLFDLFAFPDFFVIDKTVPKALGGGIYPGIFFTLLFFPLIESSYNFVNIEHPLKTISFFVKVPVLSLKTYFTFPNCSINVVL